MLQIALIAFCMCVCVRSNRLMMDWHPDPRANRVLTNHPDPTACLPGQWARGYRCDPIACPQGVGPRCSPTGYGVGPSVCTRDTPDTMRHASSTWKGSAMGVLNGRGRLDSPQSWSSQFNQIGEWYQIDNSVVGEITGVSIIGRQNTGQYVTSFKVQSKDATGSWTDVDGGKVYTGSLDHLTRVDVTFDTPVHAKYIRIYPQTWVGHMSLRADIMFCLPGTTPSPQPPPPPPPPPSTSTTTIPGGNTNVGGTDCFGAVATFGPDFECNFKVSSFCGHVSADGLDVSACCQDYCNSNREKSTKRKVSEREDKKAEGVRKSDRKESISKRKDAESSRKKNQKEQEWVAKRGAQETSNKNVEDERKTKNGFSESRKKSERSWKANRQSQRSKAQRREAERKKRWASNREANSKRESRRKETRQKRMR